MISRISIAALSLALAAALSWLFFTAKENASLQLENASLQRSMAALTQQADQAREAASVARAAAAREALIADEYEEMRRALINGDEDAEIPEWFADYIARVLGRVP